MRVIQDDGVSKEIVGIKVGGESAVLAINELPVVKTECIMKKHIQSLCGVLVLGLWSAFTMQGATIEWIENSRTTAFNTAREQGKLVFLLGGRPSCGNCNDIKHRAVNVLNPPVNQMIEECFVPWYNNLDVSNEHAIYETGLGGYSLPLYAWIDPRATLGTYLDRKTGPLDDPILLTIMRKALRKAPPGALNLTNNQVVRSASYVVQGQLFTNLIAKQFFFKVNNGAWTEAVTDGPTSWKTNWSASLAGQTLLAGAGANKFYAYAVYSDNSKSSTNTITFTFSESSTSFTIAGRVTLGATGLAGVTVSDGATVSGVTDVNGNYSVTVSDSWTGTLTPALSGYTFSPGSRSYASPLTGNLSGQDFTATPTTFTIAGYVTLNGPGLGGVTVSASGGPSTVTDPSGAYVLTVPASWTGTVTPFLPSYVFDPISRTYPTPLTANLTGENYAATSTASFPQISVQPVPVLTMPGSNAVLSVTAANATSYTWYREGSTAPVGTGPTLQLPNLQPGNAGAYYCAVSNASGGVLSQTAGVVLYEFVTLPGMRVYGPRNQTLTLQVRTNLSSSTWLNATNRVLSAAPEFLIDYERQGRTEGYYRLRIP